MTLADRLVVMNDGRIEQIGTPLEVYERPASVFVAGFIGAPPMNFLRVTSGSAVAEFVGRHARPGETLGFRPEDVTVGEAAQGAGAGADGVLTLPVTALLAEPIGSDTYLHATLGEDRAVDDGALGDAVILRLAGRQLVPPGTALAAVVPLDRVHRFDADGRRSGAGL